MPSNPVRDTVNAVEDDLQLVSVNDNAIEAFAEEHNEDGFELPSWDAPVFPDRGDWSFNRTVDFFVVGNALNFCFNDVDTGDKFEAERMGMDMDGAFGMWLCLYDETVNGEIDFTDSEALQEITSEDFNRVFRPSNDVEMPLKQERVAFLRDVGAEMSDIGSFGELARSADPHLFGQNGFVHELVERTDAYGQDTRTLDGQLVRFDKRAQLTAMMLHGYYQSDSLFTMDDIDNLTVPADYGVPNTLRGFDILSYEDELQSIVDAQESLPENSRGEVEIRAATVMAGDKLHTALNSSRDDPVSMPQLDYFLWSLRRESPHNEHLIETTAY